MDAMETTPYDGCGLCFVGMRRLSRKTDKTHSPAKQMKKVLASVREVGGHVIGWADDIEVSGATDPMTRPGFGPWLRGENGPYDGIAGAAVDRIGRNVRDVLNTAYSAFESGKHLVTSDHVGFWDLSDPDQEADLLSKAATAQGEHRAIAKRNREETERARSEGDVKNQNSYGYKYVRLVPTGGVDHVAIDEPAAAIIREVANNILNDQTGTVTPYTEAARLSRAAILSPADHRGVMYGRKPTGRTWTGRTVAFILTSEAALGFLMHGNKAVIGPDGQPVRIAPELWDRATRTALIAKCAPKRKGNRAPKGTHLLTGRGTCGQCNGRLWVSGPNGIPTWGCTARVRGVPASQHCKPAPTIYMATLDQQVTEFFISRYGAGERMEQRWDPGTGYAGRIAELEHNRNRLKDDRRAGLYDAPDEQVWFRTEYKRITQEIAELKKLPERPSAMRLMPTGQTVAEAWQEAPDDAARREMLAEYNVHVVLFPRSVKNRVVITGRELPILAA
jgi:site-specific DNA recombinase